MEEFISEAENKLKYIISELGWNLNNAVKPNEDRFAVCSKNPGHRVLRADLSEHHERCNGLTAATHLAEQTFSPCLEEGPSVFKMTPDLQEEIISKAASSEPGFLLGQRGATPRPVPESSDALLQTFTRDERRAIYDHVIANMQRKFVIRTEDIALQVTPGTETKKEMTALELAAAERDARRRRATYRNKVHTNRKTHTEIMKEVIASQMTHMLEDPSKTTAEGAGDTDSRHRTTEPEDPRNIRYSQDFGRGGYHDEGRGRDNERRDRSGSDRNNQSSSRSGPSGSRRLEGGEEQRQKESKRDSLKEYDRKRDYQSLHKRDYHHKSGHYSDRERREHHSYSTDRSENRSKYMYNEKLSHHSNDHYRNTTHSDSKHSLKEYGQPDIGMITKDLTERSVAQKESSDESDSMRAKKTKKRKKEHKHKHKKTKKRKHKKKSESISSDSSS